jgi:hypothetical protein
MDLTVHRCVWTEGTVAARLGGKALFIMGLVDLKSLKIYWTPLFTIVIDM